MEKELLIKEIFDYMSFIILDNVNSKYHQELLVAYCNYLIERYSIYEFDNNNYESYVSGFCELEINKWKNIKQNGKLSLLLKDEALDKIRNISEEGYSYAKKKYINNSLNNINENNNLEKKIANKNINLLKELLPKVRVFNKGLAKNLVSEGILDYEYASGKVDYTSFRLSRLF